MRLRGVVLGSAWTALP